jgi:nucleoside 2-deoxyribosyltransferase
MILKNNIRAILSKGENMETDEQKRPDKANVYLASGWFNPKQEEELTRLEEICESRTWINLASPRKIFVCPPDAPKETQDATFEGNLKHIAGSEFLIVNTRDKDIGTIWEAGFAYACQRPIIYFCQGLPDGAKFNLMLARSGVKVCTSFEQLEDYLDRCFEEKRLLLEPYSSDIE